MPVKKKTTRKAPVRRTTMAVKPAKFNLPYYRVFDVKFMGPTNYGGSKVKIHDLRFDESVTVPYDYAADGTADIAYRHLKSLGIKCVGFGYSKNGYVMWTKDFATPLKKNKK